MIKHHCQFLLNKERGRSDAFLRCRVKWDHNKNIVSFNVGYRIDIDKWSVEAQRCKANTIHGKKRIFAGSINKDIQRYSDIVEKIFIEFDSEDVVPTIEMFRKRLQALSDKTNKTDRTFFDCFDEFITREAYNKRWAYSTARTIRTTVGHLRKFDKNATFGKITEKYLSDFVNYLRYEVELSDSSIHRNIFSLTWFLRWAKSERLTSNMQFQNYKFRLKKDEKPIIFLEWSELMRLYKYDIPDELKYLEATRDVFCFCSFTSLRYSDVANLKRAAVFNNYISVITIKTNKALKIELNNYSKAILDKYRHVEFPNNAALPPVSNMKMNEYIKDLGKLCEINTPVSLSRFRKGDRIDESVPKYALLTSHVARRTFISNALMLGIPPNIVMRWTGHSDYNAMKPYIAIADKAKETAMNLFNLVP
jgi:integrase